MRHTYKTYVLLTGAVELTDVVEQPWHSLWSNLKIYKIKGSTVSSIYSVVPKQDNHCSDDSHHEKNNYENLH